MSNLNISIGPDEQNPGAMKGVITYEFQLRLSEREKFMGVIERANIIPDIAQVLLLVSDKLSKALSDMKRKANDETKRETGHDQNSDKREDPPSAPPPGSPG